MASTSINTIVFDLGGVLIDWNPIYLYEKLILDEQERKYFFENICTSDWNEEQDAGRPLQEATRILVKQHPKHANLIEAYYGRWEEMLRGPISETVEILQELRQSSKYRLYALTNWSHETFDIALERFEFLHWFEGIVVSGVEKTRKPFTEIYDILLSRYDIRASQAIFIDDNLRNVEAAKAVGIHSIHYLNPQQLKGDLNKLGIN